MLKAVRYRGDGPGQVRVGEYGEVARGETIDLPEDVAKALVEERPDDWELVVVGSPKKTSGKGEA